MRALAGWRCWRAPAAPLGARAERRTGFLHHCLHRSRLRSLCIRPVGQQARVAGCSGRAAGRPLPARGRGLQKQPLQRPRAGLRVLCTKQELSTRLQACRPPAAHWPGWQQAAARAGVAAGLFFAFTTGLRRCMPATDCGSAPAPRLMMLVFCCALGAGAGADQHPAQPRSLSGCSCHITPGGCPCAPPVPQVQSSAQHNADVHLVQPEGACSHRQLFSGALRARPLDP
jgi:hypothetical protein